METYEEHMQRMLAAGGAHECASDCPMTEDRAHHDESCCWPDQHNGTPHRDCPGVTEDRVPTPEARTKAGQEMESWLREPEDYEWGRKVTAAILAIEAEAAQPAPPLDTLSNALHAIGGEFCSPFTDAHPAGMHNSQAAAILSLTEQPAPPLDVAAEIAYEMKVFLHGAKSAPPVAPGWLAQIEKWRERLARDD